MNIYPIFQTGRKGRSGFPNSKQEKSQSLYLVYASQLAGFRSALEEARKTFSQEQTWPDQCDYVVYRIQPLQKTAASIAHLNDSTKQQGSQSAGGNRYSLLVSAHYLYEQADKLTADIQEYKEIADRPSAKRSKQKLIISSLRSLDSSLHDLMKELSKAAQASQRIV